MKTTDIIKVYSWLEQKAPNSNISDLKKVAEKEFGETKWDSGYGFGDGYISCTFPWCNITGATDSQDGTRAVEDAVSKILDYLTNSPKIKNDNIEKFNKVI